ncbi:MAG: PAS domain-containing protein [Coprothermobacterota bacterium]|nr:PAS domain-containing protein [Coprothermobacterota bacterium]
MLGYVPGEIDLGWRANWEQQVHPDDLSFANYPVQSDLWGETLTYDEEYRMRHKSGEWVWVRDRSQITARAADGQPLRVTGIHENINERKRVEEALYFSNQRLELAQRSAGAGIWDWDITRQHLDWSRELFLLFGLDPDETEATFDIWHQVLHSDDREIASHRIDQAIADKIPLISEHRVIHPDGQVRWIRALGNTIYDPTGQPLRMAGICIDVTERKQAEEALQKSEALLNDVSEMARVGGWELDVETKQVLWTSETYRIHEIPEGEKIDLPQALLFFDLSQRSTLETALQRCVETGEGFDLELPFTSAQSRHLWTRALGRAVKADGKVVRLTGTFQDITERKQLEERIRQVRGDLLFAVSHDLKSPIQTLRQTQEMLSQLPPAEALARFQEYGEIWRRNLQRLERMINNLVDSQRGEEDHFPLLLAPCDPTELVKRVAEDLTGYALALQIQFDLKLEAVPEGSCDEETLARVVENLLTNAIKFSPQGGRVEVRLGIEGDTLLLEVEDHGAGIPSQEQEQLFQPFQRSRSAQQKGIPGTGLGLYVCRRIVEEHGGTITLTSREGQGTKVTVRLPWRVE